MIATNVRPKRWLRKRHLRNRYGDISDKTIERMINDGRLPSPDYPFGNRIPAWDEQTLDEHDRAVVKGGCLTQPSQDDPAGGSAAACENSPGG
jgi:predicted DNA-binding transcriptional regulator AlpA